MQRMKSASALAFAAAALLLAAASASAQVKPDTAALSPHPIEVQAKPIVTFAKNGEPMSNRYLEWRGGLVLTSPSEHFGGLSGLILGKDGKSLVAVSDSGTWITGTLAYDGDRPQALKSVRLGALKALKGKPLRKNRDRDAEALTLASGTSAKGTAYIAFEQNDRIGEFPLDKNGIGAPVRYLTMPADAKRMRRDGIEGITVLDGGPHKGALIAFSENPLPGEKQHRGWIWIGGQPQTFKVPGIGDYGITDAASLADGSVLILERRFRWFDGVRIRLRHLAAEGLKPGGTAAGEVLLEADSSKEIDNLEALAVTQGSRGETVVTLLSDDNFNRFLQRTLLLQFTLKDDTLAAKRP